MPATIIDHPEHITVADIDNQPDRGVRSAMIERVAAGSGTNVRNRQPAHSSHHTDYLGLFEGDERIAVAVIHLGPAVVTLTRGDNNFRDLGRHVPIIRHLGGEQRKGVCCLA